MVSTSISEQQRSVGPDDRLDKSVLIVAGVVVLGAIMSILDITVVSVALRTFQQEFQATSAQVAWTMTGYTLALASVIPLTGWAADRFGTKRLYLLAVVLFTAGGIATPADAAMMMQLGAEGVFVGSGIFKSGNPEQRAEAIVKATTFYDDPDVVAKVSRGLGEAMVGINVEDIPQPHRLAERGW